KRLILAIDNSPTIRKIIQVILERAEYEAVTLTDEGEALRWLNASRSHVPDLLLLDAGLPKTDGYEVASRLKKHPRMSETILIMMSRRDGAIERLGGKFVGVHDYLVKPLQRLVLLETIKRHLDKKMSLTMFGSRRLDRPAEEQPLESQKRHDRLQQTMPP